jgi:hypothetical protein
MDMRATRRDFLIGTGLIAAAAPFPDVAEDADDLGDWQRPRGQAGAQGLALHEGHDVIRQAVHLARRQHGNDVRMLQPRRQLDLALEPLGVDACGKLGVEHLDHDGASQGVIVREEHTRHPASAQLADDREARPQRRLELFSEFGGQNSSRARSKRDASGVDTQRWLR